MAICRLRRLEGQGTTVVGRKALRLENFEWGVGDQKEGRARAGWRGRWKEGWKQV